MVGSCTQLQSLDMQDPRQINIEDYNYELPDHRVARFPLEQRDQSKLLVFKQQAIRHTIFRDLPGQLPENSLLVFNKTRVIHARLYFSLPNDSRLEILCLDPVQPADYQQNFSSTAKVRWHCLVGGNRKWKTGNVVRTFIIDEELVRLKAERINRMEEAFEIEFSWDKPSLCFGEILAGAGIIPLPPYLNRENVPEDEDRYQTVYAREEGSVAAPTAGLHFTPEVLNDLTQAGHGQAFVTLHVGAGTFRPVKSATIGEHHMHRESLFVEKMVVTRLLLAISKGQPLISVGTTSTRLLESLYWFGRQLVNGEQPDFWQVSQWEPYSNAPYPKSTEALEAVLAFMHSHELDQLEGNTQLIIAPGYQFRIIDGLITNFHQPRSTLLLLIAALTGEDWRRIYDYALANEFRFLSYGDSSLLLPA